MNVVSAAGEVRTSKRSGSQSPTLNGKNYKYLLGDKK